MKEPRYEVSWYEGNSYMTATKNERKRVAFYTRKKAIAFFNAHCMDLEKYRMYFAHRNAKGEIDEIIFN